MSTRPGDQPMQATRLDGDSGLVGRIRDEIRASPNSRITFARYMEMALTEPGLGYYATSDHRPTRDGDFLSAPELHPLFGRCIGRALSDVWTRIGRPCPFVVREYGAGRGTLARSVVDGLASDSDALAAAIEWQLVDVPGRHPGIVTGDHIGAVIANEYLDALPVHRLVRRGDDLLERYVTWSGDRFSEQEDRLSDPRLAAPIDAAGVQLADGQVTEVRPAADAWLDLVSRHLGRGIVLITDYGHPARELHGRHRMAGSLLTYRDHVVGDDPFVAVGHQDITAHVDFSAIERAALAVGLTKLGSTTQARLLVALGLGEMLYELGHDAATTPSEYIEARASVRRLLDPRHLGAFRALVFGRDVPSDEPLRGFDHGTSD